MKDIYVGFAYDKINRSANAVMIVPEVSEEAATKIVTDYVMLVKMEKSIAILYKDAHDIAFRAILKLWLQSIPIEETELPHVVNCLTFQATEFIQQCSRRSDA